LDAIVVSHYSGNPGLKAIKTAPAKSVVHTLLAESIE
jgi:hypothetical protein